VCECACGGVDCAGQGLICLLGGWLADSGLSRAGPTLAPGAPRATLGANQQAVGRAAERLA
jgi:hypothetical protein